VCHSGARHFSSSSVNPDRGEVTLRMFALSWLSALLARIFFASGQAWW
jgi:hypothetical protein